MSKTFASVHYCTNCGQNRPFKPNGTCLVCDFETVTGTDDLERVRPKRFLRSVPRHIEVTAEEPEVPAAPGAVAAFFSSLKEALR